MNIGKNPKISKAKTLTQAQAIQKMRDCHGDKYIYSKVIYKKATEPVEIICPEHGSFFQAPTIHWHGHQCPKCAMRSKKKLPLSTVIQRFKTIHGDKYDYSRIKYEGKLIPVEIICPEHGSFFVRPVDHWCGTGCPKCTNKISKLEQTVSNILLNLIEFEYQKQFEWLGLLTLDFYIPSLHLAIECQGRQHFYESTKFKEPLSRRKERDERKLKLCSEHNISILYINYFDKDIDYKIKQAINHGC